MKNTGKILLYGLIIAISLSCLADIGTFLYFSYNHNLAFEINPIFLLLKSIINIPISLILVILFKVGINASLIYMLLSYKPTESHVFAYLLILSSLIAIMLQFAGAYQNIHVSNVIKSAPAGTTVSPLTTVQAVSLWSSLFIWYGTFIFFEVICFMIYERLYRS